MSTTAKIPSEIDELLTGNTLFRLLAENSSDMILICDSRCKILYVNPVALELTGYDKNAILHLPATDFIHPDDHPYLKEDSVLVNQGKKVPAREIRLLNSFGTYIDVEVTIFTFSRGNESNKYLGAILRDISSHKENEQLIKNQTEWEQTFNTMTDFVSVHDKDFKVIKVNRALCDFLGKEPDEIIGKSCYQLFHGIDKPFDGCPQKKAVQNGHAVSEVINDPNLGVPLQVTCSPYFDTNGELKGSVHIARIYEPVEPAVNKVELIPICASCKDIRLKDNEWERVENYLAERYDLMFTHSICKKCQKKLYSEYIDI